MRQLIFLVVVVIILVGVVVFLFSSGTIESPEPSPSSSQTPTPTMEALSPTLSPSPSVTPTVSQKVTVTYSNSGYSPSTVTIKQGDFVVFENDNSKMMWTASAVHPTHRVYPDSGIHLCGTQTLVTNFDACRGYASGESWEFKFDTEGTWRYHNHLQANHGGTIIVE